MAQERSERTRGRLLQAGAVLFDSRGYAGATLGDIAAGAGVTKGALYFHFTSKQDLARAVFEQAERSLRDTSAALRSASSPLQALIDVGYWLVDALASDAMIRAAFRLGRDSLEWQDQAHPLQPSEARAEVRGFHGVWAAVVGELLSGARGAGELRVPSGVLGPEALVVAAACGLEAAFADGCPAEERASRVGALWEWLLPCLVPPGSTDGYRTRPPAPQPV